MTDAAKRHGVSLDGALVLLDALARRNGRQAQFNHPDLGGMGQWSQGGMIMIGDMFNQGLKYRVDALCNELAGILHVQPFTDSKAESSQSQTQGSGGEFSLFVAGTGSANQAAFERPNPVRYAHCDRTKLRHRRAPETAADAVMPCARTAASKTFGKATTQSGFNPNPKPPPF